MREFMLPLAKGRRLKRRFMDAVKEDMQVGVRVEDTKNRLKWKTVIRCGNPGKGKSRKKTKIMLPLAHSLHSRK